jgi:hypothetical protein
MTFVAYLLMNKSSYIPLDCHICCSVRCVRLPTTEWVWFVPSVLDRLNQGILYNHNKYCTLLMGICT